MLDKNKLDHVLAYIMKELQLLFFQIHKRCEQ